MAAAATTLPPLVGLSRSAARPSRPSSALLLSPLFSFATHTPGPNGSATMPGLQSCLQFMSERNLEECVIKAHHYAQCGDWSSARETYSLMTKWIDAALGSPDVGRHAPAMGFVVAREAKMTAALAQGQRISSIEAGAAVAAEAMQRAETEAAAAGDDRGRGRSSLHPFVLAYLPRELQELRSILQLNQDELTACQSGEAWNQPIAVSPIGRRRTDGRIVLFRNDAERQQWKARVQQQREHEMKVQMEQQQVEMQVHETKLEEQRQWQRQQKEQQRLQQKERLERFKQQEQHSRFGEQQQGQLQRLSALQPELSLPASHSAAAAASVIQPISGPPALKQPHQLEAQAQQQSLFQQGPEHSGLVFKHSAQPHTAAAGLQARPDELAPAARSSPRHSARLGDDEGGDMDSLSEPALAPFSTTDMSTVDGSLFQPLAVAAAAVDAAGAAMVSRSMDESQPSVTPPEKVASTAAQSAPISLLTPDFAQPIATGQLSDDGGEEVFIPLPAPPAAPKLQPKVRAEEEEEEEAPTQFVRRDRSKRRAVPVDDTPEMHGADEEQVADEILAYIESSRSMQSRAAEGTQSPIAVSLDEVRSPQASELKAAARGESQKSRKRRRRHVSDASDQSDHSEEMLQPAEAQRPITHASVSIKPPQLRKRPRSSLSDEGDATEPISLVEAAAQQPMANIETAAAAAAQQRPCAPLGVSTRNVPKRAKAARPETPDPAEIKVEARGKFKRSRKESGASSLSTSQAQSASAQAAVPASPLEVHAQFKQQQQHLATTSHVISAAAPIGSAIPSAEGATLAAAASPAPAPAVSVESPLPTKVRKLVTDSTTGQRRYEWVFEQRSWARPSRRLESRLETVEPAVADRSKAKAAGLIASMRPIKTEPVKAESKLDEDGAGFPSSVADSDLRPSQQVSPPLDDDSAAEPLSAPQG